MGHNLTGIPRMKTAAALVMCALVLGAGFRAQALTDQQDEPAASPREPTDIYIRRLAGLPASTAKGDIQIIDVGHMPTDTMISIVASKDRSTWRVSYVCAASPFCSKGSDRLVRDYAVSVENSRKIDSILEGIRHGMEPGGQEPNEKSICGWLNVTIDHQGLKRAYRRACYYGEPLTSLLEFLQPASSE